MNKKVTIFTVSYDKDLEFLKYNLKSIKKYCQGYHKNIVLLDDNDRDCEKTREYLHEIGQPYFFKKGSKHIKHGYVRQQYIKFFCDQYMPENAEFVCHVDSDNIFYKNHSPEIWFKNEKPTMLRTPYELIFRNLNKKGESTCAFERWRDLTSEAIGIDVDCEYMRGMPFVYPIQLFKECREHIEETHKCSFLDYLKDKETISEYNILGAYAYHFKKDYFHWVTEPLSGKKNERKKYMDIVKIKWDNMKHYSSRELDQPKRYIDLSEDNNEVDKLFNNE